MEEREKKIQEFYKSESDSDSEPELENEQNLILKNGIEQIDETVDNIKDNVGEKLLENENKELDSKIIFVQNTEEIINKEDKEEDKKEEENEGMEFEFNLEGIEEDSERIENVVNDINKEETLIKQLINRFNEGDGSNANTKNSDANTIEKDAKNIESSLLQKFHPQLAQEIANLKPKLRSAEGETNIIDFSDGAKAPCDEISKLMERYIKHSNTKKSNNKKHSLEFNVLSVNGNEVHKEKLLMNVANDDVDDDADISEVVEQKPGARLKKLKDKLQHQMAQKRSEFWKQRTTTQHSAAREVDETFNKDGYENKSELLDDEFEDEEFEISSSSEEEEEEDDMRTTIEDRKRKTKSAFVEEEVKVFLSFI